MKEKGARKEENMKEKRKTIFNTLYWVSILLSFPLIPISLSLSNGSIFFYLYIAYLLIWPIAIFKYDNRNSKNLKKIVIGMLIIIGFPIVYGIAAGAWIFRDQYKYRRANGTLTLDGKRIELREIPSRENDTLNLPYLEPNSDDSLSSAFEKSIEGILISDNRRVLKENTVVEILDSSCSTPLCGYLAFAKAVRVRLSNEDTLVFITLCLNDIPKADNELISQYRPGEFVEYANDTIPDFDVSISTCEKTGEIRQLKFIVAKPIGHP